MGGRDYRKRETKKPKKTERKRELSPIITNTAEVEVLPKGKSAKQPTED